MGKSEWDLSAWQSNASYTLLQIVIILTISSPLSFINVSGFGRSRLAGPWVTRPSGLKVEP
jgi:hypothetical protein